MVTMSVYKDNKKSILGRTNITETVNNWKNIGGTACSNYTMSKAEEERLIKTLIVTDFFPED